MLERCIKIEPSYIPAYVELFKLQTGMKAGRMLRNAIRVKSADIDLRLKFGFWLIEHGK